MVVLLFELLDNKRSIVHVVVYFDTSVSSSCLSPCFVNKSTLFWMVGEGFRRLGSLVDLVFYRQTRGPQSTYADGDILSFDFVLTSWTSK